MIGTIGTTMEATVEAHQAVATGDAETFAMLLQKFYRHYGIRLLAFFKDVSSSERELSFS